MAQSMSGGRRRIGPIFLPLFLSLVVAALPAGLFASESCSMMGGKCRDVCGGSEKAEVGDFEDCGTKQECCVFQVKAQCCVLSFEARDFGPANCQAAQDGACLKGSANASPCTKLPMCATVK